MKKSTKIFASAVAAIAMFIGANNANAQTKNEGDSKAWRLGVGVSAGLPTDNAYNLALGGDLRLQKDFFSNISGTLSAGYTNFMLKNDAQFPNGDKGLGFIPVKAGIKIFPLERFYISGEVGAAFGTDKGQGTALVYAPGIGVGTNTGIDIGLRYEGLAKDNINFPKSGSNLGQVALRLAYGFKLNK